MLKITAFLALAFIENLKKKFQLLISTFPVSCAWSSGLSCGSCGPECAPACGTRRFRACCFNYLRRKRTDGLKIHLLEDDFTQNLPLHHISKTPSEEQWLFSVLANENHPYNFENKAENHLEEY
ncbi:uncharacterized protein LOC113505715 [Trichoplusia ni]|uniref:Uncharacterized protein LOC113505715 n=1 Tax=Trichoplusia ni TaxID=7111 RepID=A0A7E5WUW2_TRINI|nr:uncharacterized protein LOC113505715 [Trichoplusia ni]